MATFDTKGADFNEKVLKSDKYVLVDFWASWCVPCLMMAPALEQLAEDKDFAGKLEVHKVNIEEEENMEWVMKYQIQSIPNMKLFKNGEIVNEIVGVQQYDVLKSEIDSTMKAN